MFADICLDSDREISPEILQESAVNLGDGVFLTSGIWYSCYHPSEILEFSLTIPYGMIQCDKYEMYGYRMFIMPRNEYS